MFFIFNPEALFSQSKKKKPKKVKAESGQQQEEAEQSDQQSEDASEGTEDLDLKEYSKIRWMAKKKCNVRIKGIPQKDPGTRVFFKFSDGNSIEGEVIKYFKPKKATAIRIKNKKDCKKVLRKAKVAVEKGGSTDRYSSEGIRTRRIGNVLVGGGNGIGAVTTTGAGGYYFISSDFHAGFSYSAGSYTLPALSSGTLSSEPITLNGSLLATKMRYFFGNSFYTELHLGQRSLDFSTKSSISSTTDTISMTVNSVSIYAGLSIGNQWSFDSGFTIGVDWLGFFAPLSSSSSSQTETEGTISLAQESLSETVEDGAQLIAKAPHSSAFILSLGWEI